MDAETKAIVEKIDARIRNLRQLREQLIEEFGETTPAPNHARKKRKQSTRKDEVVNAIKSHGALTTKELKEKTEIPAGTLGWILRDRVLFTRDNKSKKWNLKEAKEE